MPSVKLTSQRSAISSVLSQASGRPWRSAHSARISAGGLDVVAVAVEREPLARAVAGRDVHRAAGVDAEQVLLGRRVLLVDVVGVVGGEQRDPEVLGQPQQAVADPVLDGEAVVHQLEEVVVPAEDVLEVGGRLAGRVVVAVAQVDLDLARRAAGGADHALAVLRRAARGRCAAA